MPELLEWVGEPGRSLAGVPAEDLVVVSSQEERAAYIDANPDVLPHRVVVMTLEELEEAVRTERPDGDGGVKKLSPLYRIPTKKAASPAASAKD